MQILYIMQNLGLVDCVGFFLDSLKDNSSFYFENPVLNKTLWHNPVPGVESSPVPAELWTKKCNKSEIWQNLWWGGISPVVLCWCFSLLHSVSLKRQLLICWQLSPMDNLLMLCCPGKGFGDRQRWSNKAAITVGRALCSYRRKEKISFTVNEFLLKS